MENLSDPKENATFKFFGFLVMIKILFDPVSKVTLNLNLKDSKSFV